MIQGSGFRNLGSGFRNLDSEFRNVSSGFRNVGSGFEFRIWELRIRTSMTKWLGPWRSIRLFFPVFFFWQLWKKKQTSRGRQFVKPSFSTFCVPVHICKQLTLTNVKYFWNAAYVTPPIFLNAKRNIKNITFGPNPFVILWSLYFRFIIYNLQFGCKFQGLEFKIKGLSLRV